MAEADVVVAIDERAGLTIPQMMTSRMFVLLLLLIFFAGAAEQALAQWGSAFAEIALKVPKSVGDLAGPCLYAAMEGVSRVSYSLAGERFKLEKTMLACGILVVASYLVAALSPFAPLAFLGFGIFGLAIGICWPGAISLTVKHFPFGGALMFAALTFSGNVGATVGPAVMGVLSEVLDSFKVALLTVIVFPLAFTVIAGYFQRKR